MEMKQINESTLKISVSLDDLETYGMELKDFLMPQEKTEEFFYTILDELDIPDSFKSTGMLSFRVTPRKDRVDVFVTKSDLSEELDFEQFANGMDWADVDPEEFMKTIEKNLASQGDVDANERLRDLEDFLDKALEDADKAPKPSTASSEEEADQPDKSSYLDVDEFYPETHYVHFTTDFKTLREAIEAAHAMDLPIQASELFKSSEGYHLTALFHIGDEGGPRARQLRAYVNEYGTPSAHTRAYFLEHAVRLVNEDAIARLRTIELG